MALIHNLIEFFSTFTVIPIDPDDVKAQIIEYGVKDEIYFVGVTLDERRSCPGEWCRSRAS
jgi:hypothetical protein